MRISMGIGVVAGLLATGALMAATPEAIVDAQVAAFNRGDLKAFADCYSDDVEIAMLGSAKPDVIGKAALLDYYRPVLTRYHAQATVLHRASSGAFVSDQERVGAGTHVQEGLTIYQVADGRIRRVWITP